MGILQIPLRLFCVIGAVGIWYMPQGPPNNETPLGQIVRESRVILQHDGKTGKFGGEGVQRKGLGELGETHPRSAAVVETRSISAELGIRRLWSAPISLSGMSDDELVDISEGAASWAERVASSAVRSLAGLS